MSHLWASAKVVAGCWLAPRCQRRVLIIHFLWKSVRWKPNSTHNVSKIISDIVSANNMSVANQEETYPSLLSHLRPDLLSLSPLPLVMSSRNVFSWKKQTTKPTNQTKPNIIFNMFSDGQHRRDPSRLLVLLIILLAKIKILNLSRFQQQGFCWCCRVLYYQTYALFAWT